LRIANVRPLGIDVGEQVTPFWPTWTTDGVRLYYVARKLDRYGLYQVPLSGGTAAEIPTPFEKGLELYGYLRHRSALVALAHAPGLGRLETAVWLVPLPRGAPRRVGDLLANIVAVSPDEEVLALRVFEQAGSRILFVRLDDPSAHPYAELRLPERGVGVFSLLRWSPDGESLRFGAPGPEGHGTEPWVWETSAAGDALRPLWRGRGGTWTAAGDRFVFERSNDLVSRSDLFIIDEGWQMPWTDRRPVPLTKGPTSYHNVGLSPDGQGLLAFGEVRRAALHRFNRREHRFERVLDGASVGYVEPSPDGQWLAWVTFPEHTLWRSRPDGTERLQLTTPPDRALFPAWSPDSTKIAFVGMETARRSSLRLVAAEGGAIDVLSEEPDVHHWNPCWLPDGSLLFCERNLYRPGIFRFDFSTRSRTPLEGAESFLFPRCGRQGQILAFAQPAGPGSAAQAVVRWPGADGWETLGRYLAYPSWTRDGQEFCGLDYDANRIECYSLDTRTWRPLVEVDQPLFSWAAVPWMGLDPEDNPLVMFDRSTRDLYALDWETR
jgi:hypothetical protein